MRQDAFSVNVAWVVIALSITSLFGASMTRSAGASSGSLTIVSNTDRAAHVAVGDINRDGCPDLCVGAGDGQGIKVYSGNRNRTWAALAATGLPSTRSYGAVALADLDRNGLLDIVASEAAGEPGAIIVYRQAPLGVWTTASGSLPTSNCHATRIVLEDFNRDGRLDIAVAGPDGVWLFPRSPGAGLWEPAVHPQGSSGKHNGLAFFDWSGDGRPDLVASCEEAGGSVRYWTQPAAGTLWLRQAAPFPSRPFRALETADINHDGTPDVLAVHDAGLTVRSGVGGFVEFSAGFIESNVRSALIAGNWPVDTDREIFSCGATGLSVFTGIPGSTWRRVSRDTAVSNLKLLDLADCDRDGAPDIACINSSQRPCVYYNPPTSGSIAWSENSPPSVAPFRAQCFDAGDADRDGDADLMLGREDHPGGVAYFTGDGGAAWRNATVPELPGFSTFSLVALDDFDFDGFEDAFFLDKTGRGIQYSKRKPPLWVKSEFIGPAARYGSMTFADLRLPLKVVVAGPSGGENIHFFNYTPDPGLGTWTRIVVDTGGSSVNYVAAGDFNGDGFDEIATADAVGALYLFTYVGDRWVALRAGIPQTLGVTRFLIADMDRDSYPDVVAIGAGGKLYVILNRQPSSQTHFVDASHVYTRISVADSNQDGIPDILAAHAAGIELFAGDAGTSWPKSETIATPTAGAQFVDAGFAFFDKDGAADFIAIENTARIRLFYSRDGSPPGGWDGFSPSNWITTFNPDCRVAVRDNVGLSSSTARYSYSTNGGATWSGLQIPQVNLSPDRRSAELIARAVPFPASSRDQYRIRFVIHDVNGNVGDSPEYTVQIDAEPPTNPTLIYTFTHVPSVWNHLNRIRFSWPAGTDAVSGIAGYSVEATRSPSTPVNASTEYGPNERDQYTLNLVDALDWYIHLRTVDRAGNISAGTLRVGPFAIDAFPPSPPTVTINGQGSATWPEWFLSHQTIVLTRGMDGANDSVGVRFLINNNPVSDPRMTGIHSNVEHTTRSTTLIDNVRTWYVHAVTVDRAGNFSSAIHAGPLQIDLYDPSGRIVATPTDVAGQLRVHASEMDDPDSGMRQWSLLYRPMETGDFTTYSVYAYAGPERYVIFTKPDPGLDYDLVAKFEDHAGRSSLSSAYATRFVSSLVVETEVERPPSAGSPRHRLTEGVKVYKNNILYGTTDAGGRITIPDVSIGDKITALHHVYTKASERRDREELGGSPWAYRLYLTNVHYDDDGTSSGFVVTSLSNPPLRLRLSRDNALIGFHLVVGLGWNASAAYHTSNQRKWLDASNYLYNASDGQMMLELVEVYENRAFWDDGADVRVRFTDVRANARPDGLYAGGTWKNIELAFNDSAKTAIHELGHYGINLRDEYKVFQTEDASWSRWSTCTLNRQIPATPYSGGQPFAACVMDNQRQAFNFCDSLSANPHNADTMQGRHHGCSCWGTIQDKFEDERDASEMRWIIRRPADHGDQVPGPVGLPSSMWHRVFFMDVPGGSGYDYRFTFLKSDGTPFEDSRVRLLHFDGSEVTMGSTDGNGRLYIQNIFPADRAHLIQHEDGWADDTFVDHYFDLPDTLSETSGPLQAESIKTRFVVPGILRAETSVTTNDLDLDLTPGSTVTMLLARLRAPRGLSEPPLMTIRYDHCNGLIATHPMTWNTSTSLYEADVRMPYMDEPSGDVSVQTIDWEGKTIIVGGNFQFVPVGAGNRPFDWGSSGGPLQIMAEPGAFTTGTILSITETGAPIKNNLAIVKGPFRIGPNNTTTIAAAAGITITYSPIDNAMRADLSQAAIYKLNEGTGQWEPMPSHHDPDHGEVSTRIPSYGAYAVAGPALPPVTQADPRRWRLY